MNIALPFERTTLIYLLVVSEAAPEHYFSTLEIFVKIFENLWVRDKAANRRQCHPEHGDCRCVFRTENLEVSKKHASVLTADE